MWKPFSHKAMYLAVHSALKPLDFGARAYSEAVPDALSHRIPDSSILAVHRQGNAKSVKVRFLEGENSREVMDFNLFLSPSEVWSNATVALPTTPTGLNRVREGYFEIIEF